MVTFNTHIDDYTIMDSLGGSPGRGRCPEGRLMRQSNSHHNYKRTIKKRHLWMTPFYRDSFDNF